MAREAGAALSPLSPGLSCRMVPDLSVALAAEVRMLWAYLMQESRRAVPVLLMLGLCACGPADDDMAADEVLDAGPTPCWLDEGTCVPSKVEAILVAKCRQCHDRPTAMYAPMSLVTLEDFRATHAGATEPNYQRMQVRIHQERTPMPPITFEQLTDAEREVFDDWVAADLPAGP